jgi:hypothetical protein
VGIACIVRCIGVGVLVVSLQAGAQPPEGKGRPEHAGASPFIRFPVPQRSVGVMRQAEPKALADLPSPASVDAEKFVRTSFPLPDAPPTTQKKAPLRECGAR